jgi:hypothetical protein
MLNRNEKGNAKFTAYMLIKKENDIESYVLFKLLILSFINISFNTKWVWAALSSLSVCHIQTYLDSIAKITRHKPVYHRWIAKIK